jgi:hypothetical protein
LEFFHTSFLHLKLRKADKVTKTEDNYANKFYNKIEGETWSAQHCFGNKTVPRRVATTCRENGHRQDTPTGTEI